MVNLPNRILSFNALQWIKFTNIMLREARLSCVHNESLHLNKVQNHKISNVQ